jgi:hypothetical protein
VVSEGVIRTPTALILRRRPDAVGAASKEAPEGAGTTLVRASRLACGSHLSMREVGRLLKRESRTGERAS